MGELDHNELEHRISVLKLAKQALTENDSLKLNVWGKNSSEVADASMSDTTVLNIFSLSL